MGVTVIVNKMTVSHKGSNGTSFAFPDVCKTPSPAGPVLIPYPNIAKSSDTNKGSITVKMDGNPIMLKGSNMMMSIGDEAGTAMGFVSNKIKGKAEFVNYSFDVKVDGKNVCRLLDPTQQNMGSGNAFGPAHVQEPGMVEVPQLEGCEKVKKEQDKQEKSDDLTTGWEKSGVHKPHRDAFQKVADDFNVAIFIRSTNHWCVDNEWIPDKHQPKPHEVIAAKTISEENEYLTMNWLDKNLRPNEVPADFDWDALHIRYNIRKDSNGYDGDSSKYYGIVMSLKKHEEGKPLQANHPNDDQGNSFEGKWITGDYDLMDLIYDESPDCTRPYEGGRMFAIIKRTANRYMGWDGIQHGPQSQWIAVKGIDQAPADFAIPIALKHWLNTKPGTPVQEVIISPKRRMAVCDNELTVVSPGKRTVFLENHEDAKNALICYGCHR